MFQLLDRARHAVTRAKSPTTDYPPRDGDSGVSAENVAEMREIMRPEIDGKQWVAIDDPFGQFARR